ESGLPQKSHVRFGALADVCKEPAPDVGEAVNAGAFAARRCSKALTLVEASNSAAGSWGRSGRSRTRSGDGEGWGRDREREFLFFLSATRRWRAGCAVRRAKPTGLDRIAIAA